MRSLFFSTFLFATLGSGASAQGYDFELPHDEGVPKCESTFVGDKGVAGNLIICDDKEIEALLEQVRALDTQNKYTYMGNGVVCMVDNQYPEENGTLHFMITRGKDNDWLPIRMYGSDDRPRAFADGWITNNGLVKMASPLVRLHYKAREFIVDNRHAPSNPGELSCDKAGLHLF